MQRHDAIAHGGREGVTAGEATDTDQADDSVMRANRRFCLVGRDEVFVVTKVEVGHACGAERFDGRIFGRR